TPALAGLAARGARFPRAYTVTPWTAPALVSIFTGLYPPTHGVVNRDDTTPKTLPTLPRLLGQNGYGLVSYGFFTEVSYYRNLGLPKPPIDGAEVVGAGVLASWLRSRPQGPFFAWIHFTEPHLPYGASGYEAATANVRGSTGLERSQISATVPLGMGFTFEEGDREKLLALYDADVVRMDAALGSVLDALSASGLAEETLVVFTADHGEELLEHGFVGHASTSGEAQLTSEVLGIPLVLAGPGVPAGLVSEALAQNVDVAPTVLALAGVPGDATMQGTSLVPALRGRPTKRDRLFFDTTPGGHLTPPERRLERLQGIGDGTRIHAERTGGPAQAADPIEPALARELARWKRQQLSARLRVLKEHGGEVPPGEKAISGYAATLEVESPRDGERLGFRESGGTIRLAWRAPGAGAGGAAGPFWVEYSVGSGILSARGLFPVEGRSLAFGPFPVAFWNDLATYSPFRFRVVDPATRTRSAWQTFTVVASGS
ncbi:MAG: sulfatase, partial [Acidobacteria bacterium]|nr:sulfatase [Acidobacteriota bacterium]